MRNAYASQRTPMPEEELRKLERRAALALRSGRTLTQVMRSSRLSADRVKGIAQEHGLVIARGLGNNRL